MSLSLFDQIAADRAATNAPLPGAEETAPIEPRIGSVDHMIRIIGEVIDGIKPPEEEIVRLRGSGWKNPIGNKNPAAPNSWCTRPTGVDCARWVLGKCEWPVLGIVNVQPERLFRGVVRAQFERSVLGSMVDEATTRRKNGEWLPVEWEAKVERRMSLDKIVTVPWSGLQTGLEVDANLPAPTMVVLVPIEVLVLVVRLVDIRNATEIRVDHEGNAVQELVLAGTPTGGGSDPALAQALNNIADRLAPPVREPDDVAALRAELAEAKARAEKAEGAMSILTEKPAKK